MFSQVRGNLVPSPTPSFSLLAVLQAMYGKQRKAGRGTGNEVTLYLRGVPPSCRENLSLQLTSAVLNKSVVRSL